MWNLNEVTAIEYVSDYCYGIVFDDNTAAVLNFSEQLERGPVFAALRDLNLFKQARIEGAPSPGQMALMSPLKRFTRSVKKS